MKIAGEDIVEEPVVEEPEISLADGLGGYDEEARTVYTSGLSEVADIGGSEDIAE